MLGKGQGLFSCPFPKRPRKSSVHKLKRERVSLSSLQQRVCDGRLRSGPRSASSLLACGCHLTFLGGEHLVQRVSNAVPAFPTCPYSPNRKAVRKSEPLPRHTAGCTSRTHLVVVLAAPPHWKHPWPPTNALISCHPKKLPSAANSMPATVQNCSKFPSGETKCHLSL